MRAVTFTLITLPAASFIRRFHARGAMAMDRPSEAQTVTRSAPHSNVAAALSTSHVSDSRKRSGAMLGGIVTSV